MVSHLYQALKNKGGEDDQGRNISGTVRERVVWAIREASEEGFSFSSQEEEM